MAENITGLLALITAGPSEQLLLRNGMDFQYPCRSKWRLSDIMPASCMVVQSPYLNDDGKLDIRFYGPKQLTQGTDSAITKGLNKLRKDASGFYSQFNKHLLYESSGGAGKQGAEIYLIPLLCYLGMHLHLAVDHPTWIRYWNRDLSLDPSVTYRCLRRCQPDAINAARVECPNITM